MPATIAGCLDTAELKFSQQRSKKRFSTKKWFPSEEERDLFLKIFAYNRYDYIYRPLGDWGDWKTAQGPNGEHWMLSTSEIFKAIAGMHEKYFFGIRPSEFTFFALVDIDKQSRYRNKKAVAKIREVLADAGIEQYSLYQSSDSGGWHLYLFFDKPINTRELRTALVQLLLASGFKIENGHLEVFPNPATKGSQGHGLRLPLQHGFAWLNPYSTQVMFEREELSPSQALKKLLNDSTCSNSYDDYLGLLNYVSRLTTLRTPSNDAFDKVVSINRTNILVPKSDATDDEITTITEIFGFVPPGIMPARYLKGRSFAITGLTGPSQRHDAGLCLSHYAFYGDPVRGLPSLGYNHSDERFLFIWEILSTKHNGWSKALERQTAAAIADARSQADWMPATKRSSRLSKSPSQTKLFTTEEQLRNDRANKKSSREARKKISIATSAILGRGEQLSVRAIEREAGVCQNTVLKHDDLWKPLKERQFADRLAGASREYRLLVNEVAVPGSAPLDSTSSSGVRSTPPTHLRFELPLISCAESSWKSAILKYVPTSLDLAETTYLQFLQAFLAVQLVTSPDIESSDWLLSILDYVRAEVSGRWLVPDSVSGVKEVLNEHQLQNLLDTG